MKRIGRKIGGLMRMLPCGLLTVAALGLLLWLTLAPKPLGDEELPMFPGADKLAHAVMFGGVYFVMMFDASEWLRNRERGDAAAGRARKKAVGAWVAPTAVIVCVALGGGIELLQGAMGMGRGCEWWDFVADCVGVAGSAWVTPAVIAALGPRN